MATGGYDASQEHASDIVDDDLKEKLCTTCIEKFTHTATSAITEIRINLLCSQCRDFVLRHQFNSHEIILVKKQASTETGLDMNGLDTCVQHTKKVKFYCEDHDQLCCSGCVTTHRKCDKFTELSALSEEKEACREVHNALLKLNEESMSMKKEMGQLEVELNERVENLSSEIDEIKSKLMELLDIDKSLFLLKSESIRAEKELLIEQRKDELDIIETDISQGLKVLSRTLKKGTLSQQFIVGRAVSETRRKAQCVIERQKQFPMPIAMHLCFSNELTKLLHTKENNVRLHTDETCNLQGSCSPLSVDERPCVCYRIVKMIYNAIETEKHNALRRLSALMSVKLRDNNPNIADLRHHFRSTKLVEMFSELFDNEWTDAFTAVNSVLTERQTVMFLLDIFMDAYFFCSQELDNSWRMLSDWFLDASLPNEQQMKKLLKDSRKVVVVKMTQRISERYIASLESVCNIQTIHAMLSTKVVVQYVMQSVQLCLLMCANDPPVAINCPDRTSTEPANNLKHDAADIASGKGEFYDFINTIEERINEEELNADSNQTNQIILEIEGSSVEHGRFKRLLFDRNMFKEYTARGLYLEYVVWPVIYLHQGGPMLGKGVAQGTLEAESRWEDEQWTWKKAQ